MRILVFQHVDVEHPGVFREFWSAAGHSWVPVELDQGEPIPALEDFDLLVVMGGPMDVWQEDLHPWLVEEKAAIRRWVRDLERPYLGICFGHQLLAAALGGEVGPMRGAEVGLHDIGLTAAGRSDVILAGFAPRIETFQWHGAEVRTLPPDAIVLASNDACAVQAMRVGRHAYGFQFHCEMIATTVADWGDIPAYRESLEQALGRERAADLASEVSLRLPQFHDSARLLNANLMGILAATAKAET